MTRKSISPAVRERKSRTLNVPEDACFVWQGRVWRIEAAQETEIVSDGEKQLQEQMAESPMDQVEDEPAIKRGEKRSELRYRPEQVWDGRCLNCKRKVER